TNIYKIEKALEQRLSTLYKERGWKAEINEQLKKIDLLATEVGQLQEKESTYIEKRTKVTDLQASLAQLEKEGRHIDILLQMKERHLYVYQQKEAYLILQKERALYSDVKPFPEEGI